MLVAQRHLRPDIFGAYFAFWGIISNPISKFDKIANFIHKDWMQQIIPLLFLQYLKTAISLVNFLFQIEVGEDMKSLQSVKVESA